MIAALLFVATLGAAPAAFAADPVNLVSNPSLESGASWPTCFSTSGWGTDGQWSLVAGHTGARAVAVSVSGYTSGDRKLLQTESPACAPAVQQGSSYEAGIWYQSSAPVSLTMFRHTSTGWTYGGDLAALPASAAWAQATATFVAPAGTDQVVFGISLSSNGTLVTDDYSLTAEAPPVTTTELVSNGTLALGGSTPKCFSASGWGQNTVQRSISTSDLPAGAPTGSRSYSISMSNRVSGDAKLLPSETATCAPSVTAGTSYDVSIKYRSTATANSLTLFRHTSTGWSYWTEVKALPASATWTTAAATLPAIPAGVDRVSFGISISSNGTLITSGYSMVVTPVVIPDPPPGPATAGTWTVLSAQLPVRALHTTLLNDGRILLIAGSGSSDTEFAAGSFRATVWNPNTNVFTEIPVPYDMFCAGHVTLPDGKILLAGGTQDYPAQGASPTAFKGSKKSYYFDPTDNTFHQLADMAGAHWYPSMTKLANGDIWSAGGIDEKAEGTVLTEMFDWSAMTWLPSNQVPQTWSFWGTYPHMYLLDDGTMFYSGAHTFGYGLPGTGASLYNWQTRQIWDVPGLRFKDLRDQAGSVLLPPAQDQRVMIVGGGNTQTNTPATNTMDLVDLSVAAPAYTPGPNMPGPGKMYLNLVTLPDRTVLAADGATYNRAGNVNTAAIYNPVANAWTSIGSDPVGRNYHSTAILLPDGRVVVFGSNPADNSFEVKISMYSPPYLYRGTRPTVSGAPQSATYGSSFALQVTGTVVSASLMAPMSATHQTDTNARLVDLPLAGTGSSRVAQVPSNPNLLPPGPYMLTVLDSDGVPSIAKWVWIS